MTDSCKFVIDFLSCGCELFQNEKSGDKIIDRWKELTEQGKQEGFFPLLIVPDDVLVDSLECALEDADAENTPEGVAAFRKTILREAENIGASALLEERFAQSMPDGEDGDAIWGEFKPSEPSDRFVSLLDGKKPRPEILIAKIPAEHPWELGAWVPMGGFNDCPGPAEQVAIFKYWNEKYGAVPGLVTYDTWEMELTRPPVTDEEAEALAKEQFAFCYDIVDQGMDTIRALASTLKNSTTWFFWWD